MKDELKNLKDVLTLPGDFKPKNPSDFFRVRADFLLEIITYAEKVEEMQKALEDISTHHGNITSTQYFHDAYLEVKKLAFDTLKGVPNEQSN